MNAQTVTMIRGLLLLIGVLFATNTIPTGVDGGGQKVAATCLSIVVMLAAGDKTPDAVKDAAAEIMARSEDSMSPAVQGFLSTPGRDNNVLPNNQNAWISVAVKAVIALLTAFLS